MQSPAPADLAKSKAPHRPKAHFPGSSLGTVRAFCGVMREPEAGDRIDQYQLTALIAQGGMASIFKALDTGSGAVVALKVPSFQCESDLVFYQRFEREEEIGRRLDHPGIVKVLAPRERSRLYLAMEYVPGQTLRALMQAGQPLP